MLLRDCIGDAAHRPARGGLGQLKSGVAGVNEIGFAEQAADAARYASAGEAFEIEFEFGVLLGFEIDAARAEIEATGPRLAIAAMYACEPCLPAGGASALLQDLSPPS
jgi:hypothetical protein